MKLLQGTCVFYYSRTNVLHQIKNIFTKDNFDRDKSMENELPFFFNSKIETLTNSTRDKKSVSLSSGL